MSTPQDHYTPAQREALCKAWDMLCEHFEHVIVVLATTPPDDPCATVFDCNYHGGFANAIGLAERAKHKWLTEAMGGQDLEDHWKKE